MLKITSSPTLSTPVPNQEALVAARDKMMALIFESQHLQTSTDGRQPLPHLKKSEKQSTETIVFLKEIFGKKTKKDKLTVPMRQLIVSYLDDQDLGLLSIYLNMRRFIDLTVPEIMAGYAAKELCQQAAQVAKIIYESGYRPSKNNFGLCFALNPEIIAYAMQLAKNETVLEIAGARGECSALLAVSGAEHVYMNEIGKKEIEAFKKLRQTLPEPIKKKLTPILGDCLELLTLKPELSKKVGLVLCRNLIHFFNDKQQEQFFNTLKAVLKPGGRAIFTVNTIYSDSAFRKAWEAAPEATAFLNTQGLIYDFSQAGTPVARFYQDATACSGDKVSTDFVDHQLYERKAGEKWLYDKELFKSLDATLQTKVQQAFAPHQESLKQIPKGCVNLLTTCHRLYSPYTLCKLFTKNGFQVEYTFTTSANGHLVHSEDLVGLSESNAVPNEMKPQLVGVIVRYNGG